MADRADMVMCYAETAVNNWMFHGRAHKVLYTGTKLHRLNYPIFVLQYNTSKKKEKVVSNNL